MANNTKDKSKDTSDSSALTYEIEPVFHWFLRYYLGCVFPDAHDAITQRLEGHVSAQAAQLVHSAQLPEEALHMLQHKLVVRGNHNIDDVTWTAERLHVLLVLKSKKTFVKMEPLLTLQRLEQPFSHHLSCIIYCSNLSFKRPTVNLSNPAPCIYKHSTSHMHRHRPNLSNRPHLTHAQTHLSLSLIQTPG